MGWDCRGSICAHTPSHPQHLLRPFHVLPASNLPVYSSHPLPAAVPHSRYWPAAISPKKKVSGIELSGLGCWCRGRSPMGSGPCIQWLKWHPSKSSSAWHPPALASSSCAGSRCRPEHHMAYVWFLTLKQPKGGRAPKTPCDRHWCCWPLPTARQRRMISGHVNKSSTAEYLTYFSQV